MGGPGAGPGVLAVTVPPHQLPSSGVSPASAPARAPPGAGHAVRSLALPVPRSFFWSLPALLSLHLSVSLARILALSQRSLSLELFLSPALSRETPLEGA